MHEKTADPEKGLLSFMTQPRLRVNRATTPGRGIDHDGRTLSRGFQDGNLVWRSGMMVSIPVTQAGCDFWCLGVRASIRGNRWREKNTYHYPQSD